MIFTHKSGEPGQAPRFLGGGKINIASQVLLYSIRDFFT